MGKGLYKKIHLIDFGSSHCIETSSYQHIKDKIDHQYPGNLMFASMNVCRGHRLSRRDDFESIFYILIYLLYHRLPWSGLEKNTLN